MSSQPLDSSLYKKYNIPGPRYTSYPTVPYWEANPTANEWTESVATALEEARVQNIGAALYIHIPFCEKLCTYCGCNTRITRKHEVGVPYIQTVLKEWQLYREKLGLNFPFPLEELHLGGGTPTFLTPDELKLLLEGILLQSTRTLHSEFSIEVDPRVTSEEHLKTLQQLGFTRISLGIQDFDPHVQDIVHRVQSEDQVRDLTEKARALGFNSVNYDLIYGLPFQTSKSIEYTLEIVTRLKPDRIAFYGYAHVPWLKPSQRRFTEADLPAGDDKRALYELGRNILESSGYIEIGMDHFALKTDSLWKATEERKLHRNFMGYTSRQVSPQIGLGVSAIGDSWRVFAQNEKILETYQSRVHQGEIPIHRGHILSPEDLVLRRHILNLMTQFKTQWGSADEQVLSLSDLQGKLSELIQDELVELSSKGCEVLDRGRPFLRNICMAFDARLARKAPQTQLFSKTI